MELGTGNPVSRGSVDDESKDGGEPPLRATMELKEGTSWSSRFFVLGGAGAGGAGLRIYESEQAHKRGTAPAVNAVAEVRDVVDLQGKRKHRLDLRVAAARDDEGEGGSAAEGGRWLNIAAPDAATKSAWLRGAQRAGRRASLVDNGPHEGLRLTVLSPGADCPAATATVVAATQLAAEQHSKVAAIMRKAGLTEGEATDVLAKLKKVGIDDPCHQLADLLIMGTFGQDLKEMGVEDMAVRIKLLKLAKKEEKEYLPPKVPIDLYLQLNITAVSAIDHVAQTFGCEFRSQSYLHLGKGGGTDVLFENSSGTQVTKNDLINSVTATENVLLSTEQGNLWDPRLELNNAKEVHEEENWTTVSESKDGIYFKWRVKATLFTDFALYHFPFDKQMLYIDLVSTTYTFDKMRLLPRPEASLLQRLDCDSAVTWDLHERALFLFAGPTYASQSLSQSEYPQLTLGLCIRRKAGSVMWNIVLPMFMLSGMGFSAFWDAHLDYFDHTPDTKLAAIANTLTLILAVVALKIVTAETLPEIGYLTLVDRYILSCLLTLAAVLTELTLTDVLLDGSLADNHLAGPPGACLIGIWLAIQAGFAMWLLLPIAWHRSDVSWYEDGQIMSLPSRQQCHKRLRREGQGSAAATQMEFEVVEEGNRAAGVHQLNFYRNGSIALISSDRTNINKEGHWKKGSWKMDHGQGGTSSMLTIEWGEHLTIEKGTAKTLSSTDRGLMWTCKGFDLRCASKPVVAPAPWLVPDPVPRKPYQFEKTAAAIKAEADGNEVELESGYQWPDFNAPSKLEDYKFKRQTRDSHKKFSFELEDKDEDALRIAFDLFDTNHDGKLEGADVDHRFGKDGFHGDRIRRVQILSAGKILHLGHHEAALSSKHGKKEKGNDVVLMHGWLKKKGRVRWNRRYVHLLPDRIQYFEADPGPDYRDRASADRTCKGDIIFDRDSYVWDSKKKEGACFKVKGKRDGTDKTFHFIVDSSTDIISKSRDMWVDAMKEACILSNQEAKKHIKQSHHEGKDVTFSFFVQYWKRKLAPDVFKLASFNYSTENGPTGRIDIASRRETMADLEDARNAVVVAAGAATVV